MIHRPFLKCLQKGGAPYQSLFEARCLLIHARPECDFKYRSHSSARFRSLNETQTRKFHGLCLLVWMLWPALCSQSRRLILSVTPKYQCCLSCDSRTYVMCIITLKSLASPFATLKATSRHPNTNNLATTKHRRCSAIWQNEGICPASFANFAEASGV